ncbi:MAG: ion transporter [Candidatus Pacebacteria bacterium]|nr:ion transporter [Candidatus Paceibacterota bacterium]
MAAKRSINSVTYCVPGLYVSRGLRTLLILRVLKISYTLTSMKRLLGPVMYALSQLPRVVIFLLFVLFIFSLVGLRQFSGDFYYRCRLTPVPEDGVWELDESIERPCSAYGYGDFECPAAHYCGHPDMYDLPLGQEGMEDSASYAYGVANYDNIFKALLTSFQIITFDGWADFMYKYQDATNTYFSRIFFPMLIFVGGFFSLNLIVAVIVDSFVAAKEEAAKTDTSAAVVPKNSEDSDKKSPGEPDPDKSIAEQGSPVRMRGYSYRSWGDIHLPKPAIAPTEAGKETGVERFRLLLGTMARHPAFNLAVVALVLGNLVVLALNRHDISDREAKVIDALNTVFCGLFWLEMGVKLFGSGLQSYFANRYDIMDCVINIFGIAEVALTYSGIGHGIPGNIMSR